MQNRSRMLVAGLLTLALLVITILVYFTVKLRHSPYFQINNQAIQSIAFSPDARVLAVSTQSGTGLELNLGTFHFHKDIEQGLIIWDVRSRRMLHGFAVPLSNYDGFTACSTTGTIAMVEGRRIAIRRIDSAKIVKTLPFAAGEIAMSRNGTRIVRSCYNSSSSTIQLWDLASKKKEWEITLPSREISTECLSFAPNGSLVVAALSDKTVCVWNTVGGDFITSIPAPVSYCNSLAFSPDGDRLAMTGGRDPDLRVWKTSDWSCETTLPVIARWATFAFTPDGKYLAAITSGPGITLWRTTDWKEESTTGVPGTKYVRALTISANGKYLAAGDYDGRVHLHQLKETN